MSEYYVQTSQSVDINKIIVNGNSGVFPIVESDWQKGKKRQHEVEGEVMIQDGRVLDGLAPWFHSDSPPSGLSHCPYIKNKDNNKCFLLQILYN